MYSRRSLSIARIADGRSHAIGRRKCFFRLLYQPHELNHLAVVRKTRSFSFQKALQAFTCTFLLHYSTLAHLFTFSTFYQFRLPLLYIVKKSLNPKSVKLFLMKIFTELPWKIIFLDWCHLQVFWVPSFQDLSFPLFFLVILKIFVWGIWNLSQRAKKSGPHMKKR